MLSILITLNFSKTIHTKSGSAKIDSGHEFMQFKVAAKVVYVPLKAVCFRFYLITFYWYHY